MLKTSLGGSPKWMQGMLAKLINYGENMQTLIKKEKNTRKDIYIVVDNDIEIDIDRM